MLKNLAIVSGLLAAGLTLAGPADLDPATPAASTDPLLVLQGLPDLPESAAGNRVFLAASSCGVERWSIKTGTDAAAKSINLAAAKRVSIASLRSLAKPTSYPNSRIGTVEKTACQIDATLTKYKSESDGDLHLVLSDANGQTLIVEIPDPGCMGSSPWKAKATAARQTFLARYTPTSSFKKTSKQVRITGVGFFDKLHGQTGVAPNGIELHAVTGLVF